MELYLIRHGQSLNNACPAQDRVEDPALTDIGNQQCAHLATWLASMELTRILTSPFLRALQTAEHIYRALRLRPEVRVELHEQGGCMSGSCRETFVGRPGMTGAEIRSQFPDFQFARDIDNNGWWGSKPLEAEDTARERATRLLSRAVEEFAGTRARVAYVMHGDLKRLILERLEETPVPTPFNSSVTRVAIARDGCQLKDFNRIDHLPAELVTV